jgi:hypothetical protein
LPLRPAEIAEGRRVVRQVAGTAQLAIGCFTHAANLKALDRAWWLAFWDVFLKLVPEAVPIEFLPAPGIPAVHPRLASVHIPSLRSLAAAIGATRLFISTDSGPMHLGSATPVRTVALFHGSNPALYRPLKREDLAIDVRGCPPQIVAQQCRDIWLGDLPKPYIGAPANGRPAAQPRPLRPASGRTHIADGYR